MYRPLVGLIFLLISCTPTQETSTTTDSTTQATTTPVAEATGTFSIVDMTDTSESGTVYTFPVFSSTNPNNPHEKINAFLQKNELELSIGEQDSSIFENIWTDPDGLGGTTEMGYTVILNNDKILSLRFDKEGCGAYCEAYTTYYNFDSNTGDPIEYLTLFTEDGIQLLQEGITDDRVKMVNEALAKATTEEDEDRKMMYSGCLEVMTAPYGGFGPFYIDNGSIHFIRERCSNHAMAGLDDIGEFDNVKSFEALQPFLSDKGKELLQ